MMKKTQAILGLSMSALIGLGSAPLALAQSSVGYYTSILDIGMVTEAAVPNGSLRVLITAAASANADGNPDLNAFDFGTGTIPVYCPSDISGAYEFGTGLAVAGNVYLDEAGNIVGSNTPGAQVYHSFTCPYQGTGIIGTEFRADSANGTIVIGDAGSALVNPASPDVSSDPEYPDINRSESVYAWLQNLDASGNVMSKSEVVISAMLNEVKVSANMVSEISFKVVGVPEASPTACNTPDRSSTATLIDFGSPSLNTFSDAAQQIQVVSSAPNGYAISVSQADQMSRAGLFCAGEDGLLSSSPVTVNRDCIYDYLNATTTTAAAFDDPIADKGLGYTIVRSYYENEFSSVPADFSNGVNYRQLADRSAEEEPVIIASSTSTTNYDVYDVCYRVGIDALNHAGTYENQINYTITATF